VVSREIKSSLEIARERVAPCRTSLGEQKIKEELQREFGHILSEQEKGLIVGRERGLLEARNRAIKKARMNLLRQKEKALLLWKVRNGRDPEGEADPLQTSKKEGNEHIDEVVIEY
jgi:triphosphoribosyl-dephospho-CoA synthetase